MIGGGVSFNPDEILPDIKIRAYRLERWTLYIRSYSVKEKKVRGTRHAFQENKMPEINRKVHHVKRKLWAANNRP